MEAGAPSVSAMKSRRKSDSAVSAATKAKLSFDRRSRRRLSDHRKSGPKSRDIQITRLEGKEGRKRLSEGRRRSSKNRVAMTRRELPLHERHGNQGMKRSMSHAETPGTKQGQGFFMEVEEIQAEQPRVEHDIIDERQCWDGSMWTSAMVKQAAQGILSDDPDLQLRFVAPDSCHDSFLKAPTA